MFTVADLKADVKRVLGGADDEEFLSRLNHSVEILASESEWDPLFGYVDVCVGRDRFVTLPRQVGTVLAVSINGAPAQGHDKLYKFHLNGPGQGFAPVGYHWVDGVPVAVFKDPPVAGAKLGVSLETVNDNGKAFRVFGYDAGGAWIRSNESGVLVDGFLIPTSYGTNLPNATAPAVRYITRVSKAATQGAIYLYTLDASNVAVTKLGEYFPTDTNPTYRRIQVSQPCAWVRIAFRKEVLQLVNDDDLIPLHSKYAIVTMVKALKKLDEDRPNEYEAYKKIAVNLLTKKQESVEIPGGPSIQVADGNLLADKSDRLE